MPEPERKSSFLASLQNDQWFKRRHIFPQNAWTADQLSSILAPHLSGLSFEIIQEEFEDGTAFATRSKDTFEMAVPVSAADSESEAKRASAEFVRGYVTWLRWAADELEQRNAALRAEFPRPKPVQKCPTCGRESNR